MKRCLDTTFLSNLVRGSPTEVDATERWMQAGDELLTTAVSCFEVAIGIAREANPRKKAEMAALWDHFGRFFPALPLEKAAADLAAARQADLFRHGRPASILDLLIASIAASNNCDVIVTEDKRGFSRIGLVPVAGA